MRFLVLCCSFMQLTSVASAVMIDFDDVKRGSVENVLPYTEDGFTLTSSGDQAVYHNDFFARTRIGQQWTNGFLGWCGSCDGPYTLTLTGEYLFDLLAIDLKWFGGQGQYERLPVNITGFFGDGGSIVTSVSMPDDWEIFELYGYIGLSSLTLGFDNLSQNGALDNIVVRRAAVPEPGTFSLFALGLAVAMCLQRRGRRRSEQGCE